MTVPTQVQIGPLAYTIVDDERRYLKMATDAEQAMWGQIFYGQSEIVLNPDQGDQHKRLALLHEVLHGVWHLHDKGHESDEDVLRSITADLLDTLRRNPELVSYLVAD
jgi:Zn-dependent peptidase ImmA (M78 family)